MTVEKPLVSVIIPVYNVEVYLERCLESVTGQSYANLQIILVDDGSTDQSGRICERWAESDDRICLIRKANAGLGMARNTGLEHAAGEYIAFVDSDDYAEPQMVELLLRTMKEHNGKVCFGGCIDVSQSGERTYGRPPEKLVYDGAGEIITFMESILGEPPEKTEHCFTGLSAWGNLYAAPLFKDQTLRFLKEQDVLSEDLFFNLKICKMVDRVIISPHCLYNYCANQGSLTTRYRGDRFEASKKVKNRLELELEDELTAYPSLRMRIDRNYMNYLIVCMKQEVLYRKQFGKRICLQRLKEMAEDEMTREILHRYPVSRMKVQQRVLFSMVKREWVRMLCLLFQIRYRI